MKLVALFAALLAVSANAQTVIFSEDFEGSLANWTMTGLWRVQEASEACTAQRAPFPSGTHCMWYGTPSAGWQPCSYAVADTTPKYLTYTQPIVLPSTTGTIVLSYQSWSDTERSFEWDMHGAEVRVFGQGSWDTLKWSFNSNFWRLDTRDLTRFAGQAIELRFSFIPIDAWGNETIGAFVDDVRIVEEPGTQTFSACASDTTWYLSCPCGNAGGVGRGCKSTLSATGAGLSGSGSLNVSNDTFSLHMDGMSSAAATLFQASVFSYMNVEGIAGDGLSCVIGSFVRLVTRYAPDGALDFPTAGDSAISVLGGVLAGQTRYYAARYRDSATFCTAATFNITNTISAYWRP